MSQQPHEPEDILAAYLSEHAYAASLQGDDLVVSVGSLHAPDGTTCAICGTPVTLRADVGWTHDVGLAERSGCQIAWPGWPA